MKLKFGMLVGIYRYYGYMYIFSARGYWGYKQPPLLPKVVEIIRCLGDTTKPFINIWKYSQFIVLLRLLVAA